MVQLLCIFMLTVIPVYFFILRQFQEEKLLLKWKELTQNERISHSKKAEYTPEETRNI